MDAGGPNASACPLPGDELFWQLSQAVPIGIFVTGLDGLCRFTNARWRQIAGISAEAALGEGWACAIHPDDAALVFAEWNQAAAEQREFNLRYRFQTPAGEVTHVHGRASILRDAAGATVGLVGTIEDVTGQAPALEALRESEERMEMIIASSAEGICVIDAEDFITFTNPACEGMLGFAPGELLGLPLEQVTHTDFHRPRSVDEQNWRKGETERIRYCYRKRDGSPLWAELSISRLVDARGELIGALAMITDLTERLRAEAERERFFDLSNDLFAEIVPGVGFVRANRAWQRQLGYDPADLVGTRLVDLVHSDDIHLLHEAMTHLAGAPTSLNAECAAAGAMAPMPGSPGR